MEKMHRKATFLCVSECLIQLNAFFSPYLCTKKQTKVLSACYGLVHNHKRSLLTLLALWNVLPPISIPGREGILPTRPLIKAQLLLTLLHGMHKSPISIPWRGENLTCYVSACWAAVKGTGGYIGQGEWKEAKAGNERSVLRPHYPSGCSKA